VFGKPTLVDNVYKVAKYFPAKSRLDKQLPALVHKPTDEEIVAQLEASNNAGKPASSIHFSSDIRQSGFFSPKKIENGTNNQSLILEARL
jgi:hypothetical protein